MLLAFYAVYNRLDYDRHTFDSIYDKPEEILEKLKMLPEAEYRIYDLSTTSTNTKNYTLGDFVEDYNNEMLDGGWWTIAINQF